MNINGIVTVDGSNAIVPTDIQSRLQTTIQTHNAVSVALSGNSKMSSFLDCDGFDKVVLTALNDANTSSDFSLLWSNDGINEHGLDDAVSNGSINRKTPYVTDVKARYLKVQLNNRDASLAHTMSAWVFLKA